MRNILVIVLSEYIGHISVQIQLENSVKELAITVTYFFLFFFPPEIWHHNLTTVNFEVLDSIEQLLKS